MARVNYGRQQNRLSQRILSHSEADHHQRMKKAGEPDPVPLLKFLHSDHDR
jgi:hypothetical protein